MLASIDLGGNHRPQLGCRRSLTSARRFSRHILGDRSATGMEADSEHIVFGDPVPLPIAGLEELEPSEIDAAFFDLCNDLGRNAQKALCGLERMLSWTPLEEAPTRPVRRLRRGRRVGVGRRPTLPRGAGRRRVRDLVISKLEHAPLVSHHRMPGAEVDETPFRPPGVPTATT